MTTCHFEPVAHELKTTKHKKQNNNKKNEYYAKRKNWRKQ